MDPPADPSFPALIPAAGLGTRLRPITRYLSKPMLPVGNRPLIDFTLDEAHSAGCRPILVIGSPDDEPLQRHLSRRWDYDPVCWVEQRRPRGLAHALLRGYEQLEQKSQVAMLLPDNVVMEGMGIGRLTRRNHHDTALCFGVTALDETEARYFGNSGGFDAPGSWTTSQPGDGERIHALQEKGEGSFEEQYRNGHRHRTVGRALLPEEFFRRVRRASPDPDSGEIDDVPVYRSMLELHPARGVLLGGSVYDVGTPERYLRFCRDYFERVIHQRGEPG